MPDLLERDHEELDGVLRELLLALDHGDKDESFARLDLLWARLAIHIRAEHLCLFPAILGAGSASHLEEAKSAIGILRSDHDFFMHELAKAVNLMRELKTTSDAGDIGESLREVRGIVLSVKTRLITHNQLEESKVYGWVDTLLDEAERSALDARVQHELENLPSRFAGVELPRSRR